MTDEETMKRIFTRIEELERGVIGTPSKVGIVGRLALIESKLTLNNWLSLTIAGGIIALVIKVFL